MELNALNKYLEATQDHLGVESERYGGGFRAIIAHRSSTDFLFDMLEGDDLQGTQAQEFFWDNPLFPSAHGTTPQEALQKLDEKLGLLYNFEPSDGGYKWKAQSRFVLKAQYDADSGEEGGWYDVSWSGIVQDLHSNSGYFYNDSKAKCSDAVRRDLNALLQFQYEGDFAALLS